MASSPVAIITGASSGIGLALSIHLLTKGWKVIVADINPPPPLPEPLAKKIRFQQTDVSRIDDRSSFFESFNNEEPPKPNLSTLDVDLMGPVYGIYLFAHYARRYKWSGGRIVVTSSMAGIYKFDTNPHYRAAKYALDGLTRALGDNFKKEKMTINAILPAFVATNLAPEGLIESIPQEHITPISTIIKAYDTFLTNDNSSGETVEVSQDKLFFRRHVEYPNESQRWLNEADFWRLMYDQKMAKAARL